LLRQKTNDVIALFAFQKQATSWILNVCIDNYEVMIVAKILYWMVKKMLFSYEYLKVMDTVINVANLKG
jgi:hypothetical protein